MVLFKIKFKCILSISLTQTENMQISKLKTDLTNKSQTRCHKCQNSAEHRGHFASLYPNIILQNMAC